MPSALPDTAVLKASSIAVAIDFSEPVRSKAVPKSAHASCAPYRRGTENGSVVTWLTNTNFHCGCFGNLPVTSASAVSALAGMPSPREDSESSAPALAARRNTSRRESPNAFIGNVGGRFLLWIGFSLWAVVDSFTKN